MFMGESNTLLMIVITDLVEQEVEELFSILRRYKSNRVDNC